MALCRLCRAHVVCNVPNLHFIFDYKILGVPPKGKIGADGVARYRAEADNLENPSSALSPKVASWKIQPINVLNNINPTVLS